MIYKKCISWEYISFKLKVIIRTQITRNLKKREIHKIVGK